MNDLKTSIAQKMGIWAGREGLAVKTQGERSGNAAVGVVESEKTGGTGDGEQAAGMDGARASAALTGGLDD